jgi:hypothetical protein
MCANVRDIKVKVKMCIRHKCEKHDKRKFKNKIKSSEKNCEELRFPSL